MTTAHSWLDARVPFDDAAKQQSLGLLDRVRSALTTGAKAKQPVTIVDIGAGTGNSAHWFRRHLAARLAGRTLRWVLVDNDEKALDIAGATMPDVETVVAAISALPQVIDELPKQPKPGRLLLTCSAVLDVLTQDDLTAITETLARYRGLGLFLLTVDGQWRLEPADANDDVVTRAFNAHQRRGGKLGPDAAAELIAAAQRSNFATESATSTWQLRAPNDREFMTRFLSERAGAAIEQEPAVETVATEWLQHRMDKLAEGLTVEVDHCDVYVDAREGA